MAAVEPPARILAVGGAPWRGTIVSGGELAALVVVQSHLVGRKLSVIVTSVIQV